MFSFGGFCVRLPLLLPLAIRESLGKSRTEYVSQEIERYDCRRQVLDGNEWSHIFLLRVGFIDIHGFVVLSGDIIIIRCVTVRVGLIGGNLEVRSIVNRNGIAKGTSLCLHAFQKQD